MTEQETIEMINSLDCEKITNIVCDYKKTGCSDCNFTIAKHMAIKTLEEIQQYRALGTLEELRAKNEKLQGYRNQMSIYAEQHKLILASDVLDMLEELE